MQGKVGITVDDSKRGAKTVERGSKTQRIVHIIGQLIPGGVEMRTLELIQASDHTEFQHYIFVTSGLRGTLDEDFRQAGAVVVYCDIKTVKFTVVFFNFLRRWSIDVVHSYLMHSSGYILLIAKMAKVSKRIAHFRSDGLPTNKLSALQRTKRRGLTRLIDNAASDIVGLTPANLDTAWNTSWREDSRCRVITNGIVVADFSRTEKPEVLKADEDSIVIVHVGRGDLVTKNREKAITIIAALKKKCKSRIQLIFVGRDGRDATSAEENRVRWRELAAKYSVAENIKYMGERNDVAAFLQFSDLFLFTSTLEGLPGVVLEARASGIPIVTSDLPGVKFVAQTFSDLRMLSPQAPDEDWADAMVSALRVAPSARYEKQQEFLGSRYNFETAFEEFKILWSK
ncbi:glycosyltransferase [Yaniella halotolerans]|uniref:glycosyltransferase n=1 Tax=Yaniella halotolerans TaxID=225453 RepID=UPI0003B46C5F|nr:glycosyltransferase [Yaniella halotolerans]